MVFNMEPVCYFAPERQPQFWHFVGECGLDQKGNRLTESTDEYVFWLQMGIAFLHHTYGEPPSNWVLDILWAQVPHGEGKFPMIGIGFYDHAESADAEAYGDELNKDVRIFNSAVNWRAIASSPLPEKID